MIRFFTQMKKEPFQRASDTYLCKYGESNSEGWQTVQAEGLGETGAELGVN